MCEDRGLEIGMDRREGFLPLDRLDMGLKEEVVPKVNLTKF